MANKNIFTSRNPSTKAPATDTVNEAGGKAYAFSPEHLLAQYAATGCLNATYYASAEEQLDQVIDMAKKINPRFIAQTAIYARERGYMKDMPALLCAILASRDVNLLRKTFPRVIDNGKMLRNFVQMIRSNKLGRKSLGSAPKSLIQNWITSRDAYKILDASVGNDPSLVDIIKLTHPKPVDAEQNALFGYLLGREYDKRKLPNVIKNYEDYKAGKTNKVPENIPFLLLTALKLGKKEWIEIAKGMRWHATRMNLNTFKRHEVFDDPEMVSMIAARLRDPEQVRKARVFPYQLLVAYQNAVDVPKDVREALQDAMETATENIPEIDGQIYVFPDVSGSMSSPVTGHRAGATTAVTCRDIAALVSAAIVRRNRTAEVIPFSDHVVPYSFNPRDSIMTISQQIANLPSGGTNCSAPLAEINRRGANADLIVYVSDNQSWVDNNYGFRSTGTMGEFEKLKKRNPKAKMVCIDIQPYGSSQAKESKDVLNIGGFSDDVFDIISEFAHGRLGNDHWVGEIERIAL